MLLTRYKSGIEYIYKETVDMGLAKLVVAYEQHTEDILLDLWSKSQSSESFAKWKEKLEKDSGKKRARKNARRGKATISGPDLAQM